jgi:hypothetical protein
MIRASTQYKNMAATVVFTTVLGALLYIITDDQSLRLHLLLVTGGLGLIVAVVFGIQGAWYSLEDRADATRPLRLRSIKGLIIMACVTGYFGLQTVVNLSDAQRGGIPGKVNFVIAATQATLAIYGIVKFLTFLRIFLLERRMATNSRSRRR